MAKVPPRKNCSKKTIRIEVRKLKDLVPFPLQPEYYDATSEDSLRALAADIKANGLDHKIVILPANKAGYPPNTILGGHRRKYAMELNGVTQTEVEVRYDLADADASTIELAFFHDNSHRRNLDLLAEAKIALRKYEIAKGYARGKLRGPAEQDCRDRIGKLIGMSGRNLQRYWNLLKTPTAVQNAFRQKQLSLVVAGKVAFLSAQIQNEIATRIKSGENPKEVVASHVEQKNPRRHSTTENALESLRRSMVRGVDDLKGRLDELDEYRVIQKLEAIWPDMEEGLALIQTLRSHVDVEAAKRAAARPRKSMEEHVADLIKFRNRGDQESEHNAAAHDEEE
jgi:hypothetical protein